MAFLKKGLIISVLLRHMHRNFYYKKKETKQYDIVRFIINIRDQLHILRHQCCTQACPPNFISGSEGRNGHLSGKINLKYLRHLH